MMKEFFANSYLFGGNAPFVEQLYEDWLENPQSVPAQWQEMITDPEYKIGRPRQLYKGATKRDVKPLDKR